jgi:hypothetical protein
MDDKKLMQLGPCELARRSLNEIKRAFELGYDIEARCDYYEHDFSCSTMNDYVNGNRDIDWSLLSSVYRKHAFAGTMDSVIPILEFIKRYSKRTVVVVRSPDTITYPQEDYLVLEPVRISSWVTVDKFTFHNPAFKYCIENGYIIAKSAFIQTNLQYFSNQQKKQQICRCNHERRIRVLCENCENQKHFLEFIDIVDNLKRKQFTLFEILLNKYFY